MIDRTRRFLSSAGWLSAINIPQVVLLLAVSIVLARSILPDVFGVFAFLLALAEGLSPVTGFGVNTSILQNRFHPPLHPQDTGFALNGLLVFGYLMISAAAGLLLVPGPFFPYLLLVCGKAVFMLAGVHTILLQKDRAVGLISGACFSARPPRVATRVSAAAPSAGRVPRAQSSGAITARRFRARCAAAGADQRHRRDGGMRRGAAAVRTGAGALPVAQTAKLICVS